jgi:predicted amidohydrolase
VVIISVLSTKNTFLSSICQVNSTDIADFFCELYDALEGDHKTLLALPELRPATRSLRDRVSELVCSGDYEIDVARGSIDDGPSPAVALGHLWGIDAAFERINPYRATDPPFALRASVELHAQEQRFSSSEVGGALIARSQSAGRPNQEEAVFADAFSALLRVSRDSWDAVERVVLPLASQLSLGQIDGGLKVASAPVMEQPDDVTWTILERNAIRYYRIAVVEMEAESRLEEIVDGLIGSNCHVALMPELSCSDALVASWRDRLRDQGAAASSLRWLFTGSGDLDRGTRPVNAGVLLDVATGNPLFRHDKMYSFTLTPTQIYSWALPLPDDSALDEDIHRGETLRLAQTGLGWITVLICQDLAEIHALDDVIIEHGVRWILAPVFSEATKRQYWEHQKAKHYAAEAGTSTVAANSLVVSRCQGHLGAQETAVACGPGGVLDLKTASATDIAGFRLGEAEITSL